MGQRPPPQLARPHPAVGALREAPALERADHAVGRTSLPEGLVQVVDRRLHLLVGVHDPLAVLVIEVADRHAQAQLAALGGVALGALQARGHDVQLGLGPLGLQAQDHPVVEVLQVVDPVGVHNQGVGQRAELK